MEDSIRRALGATRDAADSTQAREAAVAVVLAGSALDVLLIRRADHPKDPWSGHMALPGGRRDPSDMDLQATAERETHEEVGIDLTTGTYWGRLPPVQPASRGVAVGLEITPFVYRLAERPSLRPNASEVASTVWVPLASLASGKMDSFLDYQHQGNLVRFPAFLVSGQKVWGITHHILTALLDLVNAPSPP